MNVVFFPQHFLGLQGMPRRSVDYPVRRSPTGTTSRRSATLITLVGLVVFLVVLVEAAVRRRPARANPWGAAATTLEWTLPSPPPFHQFNELPVIHADSH